MIPDINPSIKTNQVQQKSWQQRLGRAIEERKWMAKFWATLLIGLGILHTLPAIWSWQQLTTIVQTAPQPRWAYFQIFVAAIHFLYALLIFQLTDWSTLRGVAVVTMVIGFIYGLLSTGLLIGQGAGWVATALQISDTLVPRGIIWSVAMMSAAALFSYGCGKEASSWRRSEVLLLEILQSDSSDPAKSL